MKLSLIIPMLLLTGAALGQKKVLTLTADSVKVTNCDSAELIIENHTQGVNGFLYNTGNGRTIFKKGVVKVNDSLFIIGADSLKYNAWVQNGNRFGTTGVLGTLDNNHVDLYTNDSARARMTNRGNFLLGTTVDNGSRFQVNGTSSFSGNVNIGTATITNAGSLIGTNAILFNHMVGQYHFQGSDMYVSRLENVLYNYQNRLKSSRTISADSTTMEIDISFPSDEILPGYFGLNYGQGMFAVSFYSGSISSVTVSFHDSSNNIWRGPYTSSTNLATGGPAYFLIQVPPINWINAVRVVITPGAGINASQINLSSIEYTPQIADQGLVNTFPYIGKTSEEHTYNNLYFKNAGVDNARISPFLTVPNYFLNNILIGSKTDNNGGSKLQVTGNISATGSVGIGVASPSAQLHTNGTVRFAGLTNDSTKTQVLVSDANGNLYYRSAASIASNGLLHSSLAGEAVLESSLAVKGNVDAKDVCIKPAGWADYVFAPDYKLPDLEQTAAYIKTNGHLPGIASADEVRENGIKLGELQASLLKKIEELTLYAIAEHKLVTGQKDLIANQEAALKTQAAQMQQQQAELDALKAKVQRLIKMMEQPSKK